MAAESARLSEGSILGAVEPMRGYLPFPVETGLFDIPVPAADRILFCGSPWIQHRAHKVLHALREFDADFPLHWLLEEQERGAAEELIREFGVRNVTLETERSVARWEALVRAGGVAVHTLFSVYGQTGPYLAVSLAAGLPVLVTKFGHSEQLPDAVAFKIQPGDTEAEELKGSFQAMLRDGQTPETTLGRQYARELHAADSVAAELGITFHAQRAAAATGMARWQQVKRVARQQLLVESKALVPAPEALLDEQQRLRAVFEEFQWTE
jgi:hypothetical protein